MKINRIIGLFASLACLGSVLAACTKNETEPGGRGYVAFYTATDTRLDMVTTKADEGGDDAIAVKIYDSNSALVWSCEDYSQVADPIDLSTGIYTVTATCGTTAEAAFDIPFYSCTDKFTIYDQQITTVDLTLTLEAVKVTAAFTDDFDVYFTKYDLSVSNGPGTLVFSEDEGTLEGEGYFSVTGSLSYTLSLTNTNGEEFTLGNTYTDVQARQYYAFSFSIETQSDPDGAGIITIIVDDSLNEKDHIYYLDDLLEPTPVTVSVTRVNAWAEFATVSGAWTGERPEGIAFEWRVADGGWQSVEATIDSGTGTFSAEIRGLSPETPYEVKAVATDVDESEAVSFTTEDEQTVPNMNFDTWYDAYTPNADENETVWDTANGGTSLMSVYPTTREDDHLAVEGEGKHAARMESKYVVIKFAAGNIYTGKFGSANIASMSASLDWGYEFTSRPLALKGWYDYTPVAIDRANDPYTDLKGQMDVGQIQIFLTDWDSQFTIDSGSSTYVDFDADYIIARGVMLLDQTDGYTQFTLNLDYRDTERTPTYIVITCSSSAYGDYFTGGTGSLLYVDELSLVYDPNELD